MINTELRYWVFCGDKHEPNGGAKDLNRRLRIKAEAIAFCDGYCASSSLKWAHVMDVENGKVVYETTSDL